MTERAVILAGGRGRRLAPYTAILPKPLMPLSEDMSIIEHVLAGIAAAGITQVTVTLGYLGHLIEAVVGSGVKFGVDINFTRETVPLGTAGPLSIMTGIEEDDRILVVNGDTYTNLDYREVLAQLSDNTESVVACVARSIETNYGVLTLGESGQLLTWEEKPTIDMIVSTGIYALRGSALNLLENGKHRDMPDLLQALNAAGRPVKCFVSDCEWRDLGRPEDFAALQSNQNNNAKD